MSYNSNLYQYGAGPFGYIPNQFLVPPPPPHAPLRVAQPLSDEDIVKQFERKITNFKHSRPRNTVSISKIHHELRDLAMALNEIKQKQKLLTDEVNSLSDEQWSQNLKEIEANKEKISKILSSFNDLNTDVLRKVLAKRSSKRERQKRQKSEKRKLKDELKKQNEEKSRKIDEYLQKYQNNITKARQEEEAKLQADAVLKETIRKKDFAKKYIVKIDALIKLRRARMNTAKGRGETLSQKEAEVLEINLEKLKSLWSQRLTMYEKEESELRVKLQQDSEESHESVSEREVQDNLNQWTKALFGGTMPQVDFQGNIARFVSVREHWDKYLSPEGTPIPIGWVPPPTRAQDTLND